ncbi:MAG: DNA alkylation repair protein [Anaeroplasmataceae bacterium]
MIDEIKKYLNDIANDEYCLFSNKIIKTNLKILGVKTPVLRDLAKKIAKNDYELFLSENDYSSYELALLSAFVIGYAKMENEKRLDYIEAFIPKIDNWAVHDGLVSSLKFTKKNKELVFEFLKRYIKSKKEYEVRFVAIMLMDYYLCDEYIDEDFKILKSLYTKDYYAKMGVAWFLATAAINYSDRVYIYLKENNDLDILNMTIRKIRDSYRIDPFFKEKVLELKK